MRISDWSSDVCSSDLEQIVGDVVDNLSATAKAELALLEARSELALHGATWTAAWGTVAASALGIAMLALAFGAILALAPHVGPFVAPLIVVAVLLVVAGFAGWRARRSHSAKIGRAAVRERMGRYG